MSSSTRRLEAINSRRVECACIAEEVDQDLLDLHAVDQDQIMSRVQVEADPDILLARAGEPKPPASSISFDSRAASHLIP